MLTKEEERLIKKLGYIPDELLPKYLEGKLTTKPDYGPEIGSTEVPSRYEEYRANMLKAQKEANKKANPRR